MESIRKRTCRGVLASAFLLAATGLASAQSTATVRGKVASGSGEPVAGAIVGIMPVRFREGRLRVLDVSFLTVPSDEHGAYRFDGLTPGRYLIEARAHDGSLPSPDRQYPLLLLANPTESKPITLSGDQTLDVNLVTTPLRTARISGRVISSRGQPLGAPVVMVPSQRSGAIAMPAIGAVISPDSRFEFTNVPPGEYVIQATQGRHNPSTEGDFAGAFVTVDGIDLNGVALQATAGSTVRGRVVFAKDEPIPQGRFVITPARADFDQTPFREAETAHADVGNDQTFDLGGLHGPRRLLLGQAPAGWLLKSVIVNGVDVTDRTLGFGTTMESLNGVEIVVTSHTSEISGVVVDGAGRNIARYALLVFPVDRALRYPESRFVRRVSPDARGTFRVPTLPSASYFVAAIYPPTGPAAEQDDGWQDPETLEILSSRAMRVSAVADQRVVISVTMTH